MKPLRTLYLIQQQAQMALEHQPAHPGTMSGQDEMRQRYETALQIIAEMTARYEPFRESEQ
jgi:hypothetical protein